MTTMDRVPFTAEPPPRMTEAELARRWAESYPEAAGPGAEDGMSGAVSYGHPPDPRIGKIPVLLTTAEIEAENARRQADLDAMTPELRAAVASVREMVRSEIGRR